jgi:ubiquinone/menaquinone biosynthesis C-methylase UbiE
MSKGYVYERQGVNKVREFYEKTAEDYDKEYEAPRWKLYHEITWENIKRFLPKRRNGLILDAGGGTGYWAIKLAKQGYRIVLTDISESMLKVAKRKIKKEKLQNRTETRVADIRDMSCFTSNQFDLVLAEGDPVSYCLNPERAVRELARVAKPNAPVIISVDSKYPIFSRLIAEKSYDQLPRFSRTGILKLRERGFEFQAFTPEELKMLFKRCGLRLVRIIGKPILTQLLAREERDAIIKEDYGRILNLELRLCDVPSLVGVGGHLEAVGLKQRQGLSS